MHKLLNVHVSWVITTSLFLILASTATAQIVDVGGPLMPGYARPPLHLNLRHSRTEAAQAIPPGYSPGQIQAAYGFSALLSSGYTGAEQTIAIVDAYGDANLLTDVSTFNAQWNPQLPQFNMGGPTLNVVAPFGTSRSSSGWALETALDVEWAHTIAPQANVLVVAAKSSSLSDLLQAVQYASTYSGVSVVSMSWGSSEFSSERNYDSYFNVTGVTFVASSGDSGELRSGVEWPAASPYVVSVGGTSLSFNGSNWSETAWSGSGGGISLYQRIPSFQSTPLWQPFNSGGMRTVPDVSYVADPNTGVAVYCAAYGGWVEVGGTSVGAPQWSALVALVNQYHSSRFGSGNPVLYSVAPGGGSTSYGTPLINGSHFNDITSGNDGSRRDLDDNAVQGYDYVTGLGTPVANGLVPIL